MVRRRVKTEDVDGESSSLPIKIQESRLPGRKESQGVRKMFRKLEKFHPTLLSKGPEHALGLCSRAIMVNENTNSFPIYCFEDSDLEKRLGLWYL